MNSSTRKLVGTLAALGIFVVAGVFYGWMHPNPLLSVGFGLLLFIGFGILFATWFRR